MTGRRTLQTALTIAAYVACTAAVAAVVAALVRPVVSRELPSAPPSLFGDRVLIIAPHPDDEVLSSGGLIQQLLARGAQVRVVIVTAGDGYARAARDLMGRRLVRRPGPSTYLELGQVRHEESLAVARTLGLEPSDVISLGFPDSGIHALWGPDWSADTTHVGRNGSSRVPYEWAYAPGAQYSGRELTDELVRVVGEFGPDTVISSDACETHPDHAFVDAFTMLALAEADFTGRHLTYVVHSPGYPYPWAYLPFARLLPPGRMGSTGTWYSLPLSAGQEHIKLAAIRRYRSQVSVPGFVFFLESFVRRNELFDDRPPAVPATAPGDDMPAPGGAGTVAVASQRLSLVPDSARTVAARLVRGPHTMWIGIVCAGRVATSTDYAANLALTGPGRPTLRMFVRVRGGVATVIDEGSDSLVPVGVTGRAAGDTQWVLVPSEALAGYTRAIVVTSADADHAGSSTPAVDVRL